MPLDKTHYSKCLLCPRHCGVNRLEGQRGYCGETAALRLAFAGIHRGEEPPITGTGGSGTVFVSGCNLGCAFCQNFQISQGGVSGSLGRAVDSGEFAAICLMLQEKGAENINIVTGSHAAPAIASGLEAARKRGLCIPVLWNSSGYEGTETLKILKNAIDVYLPDLKTLDREIAARYFNAPDYPECATEAILKMIECRELRFGPGRNASALPGGKPANTGIEILVSGVMVRHLILPGHLDNTRQVLAWFAGHCRGRALLSLMTQFTPVKASRNIDIPDRFVLRDEYEAILTMLDEYGIDDGFCQELVTGSEWLPDFSRQNPFSSELSVTVWR